ncbi:MAG: ABC transporter ATP-binding protein [Clostridia bacterium]|nr:ABC transporter ATP-binding protein [Clostridia bacterium]
MNHPNRFPALRWIAARARGQYIRVFYLILSDTLSALLAVSYALLCRNIIDAAVAGDASSLLRAILLIASMILLDVILQASRRVIAELVAVRLNLALQNHAVRQLIQRNFSAVAAYHSGELLNRIFSDVRVISNSAANLLPSLSYMAARLLGAAAALFALAPRFTLLCLIIGAAVSLLMMLMRNTIKRLHKESQAAEGKTRSFMQEIMERLLVIKVFGAAEAVQQRLMSLQEALAACRMKSRAASIASSTGFSLLFDLGHFSALVWGALGILNKTISYGTLTAMLQLVGQVQQPFSSFSNLIAQVFTVTASAERLMELEELPLESPQPDISYDDLVSIRFDHIDFTYGRTDVLRDVNITLRKGDMISITGISGGGKSTLFLLLLGAYKPAAGEVCFALSTPPYTLAPGEATRRLCAYVPQGNYLLSGTLRENLTLFSANVAESSIWQALAQACAADFVRELPLGLETPLGERGHGLSEGQMQRIAIARALLSNAPVLLLDEATSALDEATEALLLQNISALQHRTCLIVTHRRSALAICSRHLLIQDGRVFERTAEEIDNL